MISAFASDNQSRFAKTALNLRHTLGRGIFHVQRFAGVDLPVNGVRGLRGFGKTREDQAKLVFVCDNVANSINTGLIGLAGRRIGLNVMLIEPQSPIFNRSQGASQSEEGKKD